MSKTADKKKSSSETAVKTGAVVLESKPAEPRPSASKTGEPNIRIDSGVTRRIRQHARAHLKTEVCGVLIGESTDTTIEIRASIEALNAAQAGTHVTFTQDAWEEIYKVKDDLYPDARIVGWYHSHPGFGIFLSEHDLFIQENFFSSPGQIAWVYDPHSDDEGCFGWVAGKVARLTSISTLYQSGDPVEHATKGQDSETSPDEEEYEDESPSHSSRSASVPLWVVISRNLLTHLTVLLLGFAVAFFFFRPPLLVILPSPSPGVGVVFDYDELVSYLHGTGSAPKPRDVISIPDLSTGQSPPASTAPPATSPSATTPPAPTVTSPSTAPPAANAPAPSTAPAPPKTSATSTTAPPPANPQPAKPQPAKPGSPK